MGYGKHAGADTVETTQVYETTASSGSGPSESTVSGVDVQALVVEQRRLADEVKQLREESSRQGDKRNGARAAADDTPLIRAHIDHAKYVDHLQQRKRVLRASAKIVIDWFVDVFFMINEFELLESVTSLFTVLSLALSTTAIFVYVVPIAEGFDVSTGSPAAVFIILRTVFMFHAFMLRHIAYMGVDQKDREAYRRGTTFLFQASVPGMVVNAALWCLCLDPRAKPDNPQMCKIRSPAIVTWLVFAELASLVIFAVTLTVHLVGGHGPLEEDIEARGVDEQTQIKQKEH
jgi:hypothetical protein